MEYIKEMQKDRVTVYAAQAAFFILISAIPFIMMLLSLLQFIIPVEEAEILSVVYSVMPEAFHTTLTGIISELFSKSAGTIVSVTVISLLWSASKSIYALAQGFNIIYAEKERRHFIKLRLQSLFYTITLIIIILFTQGVLVFGRYLQWFIIKHLPAFDNAVAFILNFRTIFGAMILTLFFALLYKVLPVCSLKFKDQLPGAILAAAGWLAFSYAYSIYISSYANYSFIYGSLTAIVLMMLWLYSCMVILLAGAEFNMMLKGESLC